MVAITIVTFIFGAVYTTFATISESDKRASAFIEEDLKVRSLSEYLMKDISSAFINLENTGAGDQSPGLVYGLVGEAGEAGLSRLDFTAIETDTGTFNGASIVEIGYFLVPSKEGGYALAKRVDDTPDDNLLEGGSSFELVDGLTALSFRFRKAAGEWEATWDSLDGRGLPDEVHVEVILKDDNGMKETPFSLYIPLYIGKYYE